jgi:hypothetical protein
MTPISPFSPVALPSTLAVLSAFLPTVAAIWARRSPLRDPVGHVAVCWFVMAVLGSVGFFEYFVFHRTPSSSVIVAPLVTGLFPVLLLPPTLTWVGGVGKRLQWPVLGVWLLLWAVAAFAAGGTRRFTVVVDPFMSAAMGAASAWALAAQVRRAPRSLLNAPWLWILVGHVVYFTATMIRMPLIETLVAHHWAAGFEVHNGIMWLYTATYVVIARGMLLRQPAEAAIRLPTPAVGAA